MIRAEQFNKKCKGFNKERSWSAKQILFETSHTSSGKMFCTIQRMNSILLITLHSKELAATSDRQTTSVSYPTKTLKTPPIQGSYTTGKQGKLHVLNKSGKTTTFY